MGKHLIGGLLASGLVLLAGGAPAGAVNITVAGTVSDAAATVDLTLDGNPTPKVRATKTGNDWTAVVNIPSGFHSVQATGTNALAETADAFANVEIISSLAITITTPVDNSQCGADGICHAPVIDPGPGPGPGPGAGPGPSGF